eukprot:273636-Chlamydomonas_euryale.AAC.6
MSCVTRSTARPHAGTLSDPNLVGGMICLPDGLGMASPASTLGWLRRISHYMRHLASYHEQARQISSTSSDLHLFSCARVLAIKSCDAPQRAKLFRPFPVRLLSKAYRHTPVQLLFSV